MKEASMYNEAALKSFIISTPSISEKNAINYLDSTLNAASGDSAAFHKTVSFLEKPFGDPNSAYRNENLYSELLQAKIKSSWYDSLTKTNVRRQLYLVIQNRVGSSANDFIFVTPEGIKKKLYDVKADYTLLLFYNPECDACKEMKAALTASQMINDQLASKQLKVLAVYTDTDLVLWRKHLPELPNQWIAGRDENEYLYKNDIYDLKAIPTIYLLDKNKKVVLKDCMSIRLIEHYLQNY